MTPQQLAEIRVDIHGTVRPPLEDYDWEGVAADLLAHIDEQAEQIEALKANQMPHPTADSFSLNAKDGE